MIGIGAHFKSKYTTQIISTVISKFNYRMIINKTCFYIVYLILVNILTFSHGLGFGWISPLIRLLQSDETPMTRPITTDELSWIGAYVCIGGILGNIFFGLVIDRLGRKWSIILSALPNMGLWITSIFATEIYHFYIARFLGGLTGGGIFVCFPIFVAEISSNK